MSRGGVLYREGDPVQAFYRVETGCVRLQVDREDGHRQILAFCLPGDIFGWEYDSSRAVSCECAANGEVTRFDLTQDQAEGPIGPTLLLIASATISALTHRSIGLSHATAEGRLLWFLDWLAERQNVPSAGELVVVPMSRRDIADHLDLAQETLSRAFTRLEARDLITVLDRHSLILRPRDARPATAWEMTTPGSRRLDGDRARVRPEMGALT